MRRASIFPMHVAGLQWESVNRRADPLFQFSTTTTGSKVNLPAAHALITRKDLRQSIVCFEEVSYFCYTEHFAGVKLTNRWDS